MPNIFFTGAYGDVELTITQISTEGGRDVVVQSPARGDRHALQDRGRRLGRCDVEICFIDEPGKAPYMERWVNFRALVEAGEPQIFSHPLRGPYLARAEGMGEVADSSGQIVCSCTFLPENEQQPISPIGAGSAPVAGLEGVTAAASIATEELAKSNLSTPAVGGTVTTVTAWAESTDLDPQRVFADIATVTGDLDEAIDDLELASDISRWQSYRAMIGLRYQAVRAAEAFTSSSPRMVTIVTRAAAPLLALCAEVYGAELAPERSAEVARINGVRNPGRVPAGTELKFPGAGA